MTGFRMRTFITLSAWVLLSVVSAVADDDPSEVWLDSKCFRLPSDKLGPFVRLADGAILTIDENRVVTSRDGGHMWEAGARFPRDPSGKTYDVGENRALLRTRAGTLLLAFLNVNEAVWHWDAERKEAPPGTRLPTYVARSLDDGKTWQDVQMLHESWTGDIRDMIETRDGHIILSSMNMLADPTRHAIVTYSSSDEGKTWTRSNILDLGGHGHHGGLMEATLAELTDGRIWMLIRTNWDRYWEAFSQDGGVSWRTIGPSRIAASSSPAQLARLASGRLVLVWNRLYPEGRSEYERRGGDGTWAEVPASYHREELSIAFSDDDGKTWTRPAVIARKPKAWLAYPYIFEAQAGELWVTTQQGGVRLGLHERDFLSDQRVSLDAAEWPKSAE
jgi:sialidase-1